MDVYHYGFRLGSGLFQILFTVMFIVALVTILGNLFSGLRQHRRDNQSPRLTVDAKVVAKRADVHHYRSGTREHRHTRSSTTYFATFQVESGDRMELQLDGSEYGLLVEGDSGKLTFQGSRYLGFERSRPQETAQDEM